MLLGLLQLKIKPILKKKTDRQTGVLHLENNINKDSKKTSTSKFPLKIQYGILLLKKNSTLA